MNKKILLFLVIFSLFAIPAFSKAGFEFGFGSGYIFYGSTDTKDRNKVLGDTNQTILATDALFLLPMNDFLVFSLGGDAVFDFRWKGSNHIYLIDYAFLTGFKIFPKIGGLFFSVDYALGRRTDFVELDNIDDTLSTSWGNGFKFALGYDFSPHLNSSIAPVLAASLKSMPRGGSRDNLFCVSVKITKHK
ncbi:hypothetical protein [Treponema sp.]|uniref:hypothetical protein n=1 Tax=Treponema sp. TaxID=166 RepID=UPI0025F80676|nr:hypothetical protein [Treponema sp.]MBR4321154.1 hypothetical protein [Treponema sp.]